MAARMTSSSAGVCGLSVSSIETSGMKLPSPFCRLNLAVDPARLFHGGEIFGGSAVTKMESKCAADVRGNVQLAGRVPDDFLRTLDIGFRGGFADPIGDVNGVKVAGLPESDRRCRS